MRIPPSVIVMSLVTAVPFALAVHDTMKPHEKTYEEMTDEEREAKFEAEMQKEAAEQAARDAAETAKIAATDKTYFGPKPAQLGSFFTTVHLGMAADDPAVEKLTSQDDRMTVRFEGDRTVDTIIIQDEEHCSELRQALESAWGETSTMVYVDAATHQRASFHDCAVRFDRYL